MKKNIGKNDRFLRFIIATILLSFSFLVESIFLTVFLLISAIFVFYEFLVGWCAFYALIGKNTCPIDQNNGK